MWYPVIGNPKPQAPLVIALCLADLRNPGAIEGSAEDNGRDRRPRLADGHGQVDGPARQEESRRRRVRFWRGQGTQDGSPGCWEGTVAQVTQVDDGGRAQPE